MHLSLPDARSAETPPSSVDSQGEPTDTSLELVTTKTAQWIIIFNSKISSSFQTSKFQIWLGKGRL